MLVMNGLASETRARVKASSSVSFNIGCHPKVWPRFRMGLLISSDSYLRWTSALAGVSVAVKRHQD